ncbi:MAG: hypothetical protein HYX34_03230 [Actinobacteria bacterium]|nr:hypothetical protein [Actinomycetota bacterium]
MTRPVPGPVAHRRAGGDLTAPARRIAAPDERAAGIGSISAAFGVAAFLGFLFFAVQLLTNLYATSVTTANAYDAARQVAAYQVDRDSPGAVAAAERRAESDMRARMGSYGRDRLVFDWSGTDADAVRLRVRAENPSVILFFKTVLPFTTIDRTVTVRVERLR